ncbi:MAG: iron ABC transporter ATP-binding protein [Planctomycetaceae bacterium]|jgi:iron complex transport system ATP-binding protein|nr:iron ABC transporter ATP-binding protein [Planctomycetaceae bacterium]
MNAIELEHVTVEVPGVRILNDICWQLPVGQKAAVLGPNGCGKSTLLRTITGYGHVTSGTVRVLGETLGRTEIHDLRRRLGVVDTKLARLLDPGCSVEALVATGLYGHLTTFFDRPTEDQLELARRALDDMDLLNCAKQPFETLSSGQFGRVWLARALINDPELLILDEPASDLDLPGREALLSGLVELANRKPQITLVTVSHHLEDLLPETDQIVLLRKGEIHSIGHPGETLTDEKLSATFGSPIHVRMENSRWRFAL